MIKETIKNLSYPLVKARPDFLIVGTQKAGTTSLYHYLARHPQVLSNRTSKELHFFNLYYERGMVWYLSHFPYRTQKGKRLCFEATPDYLHHPLAPQRIKRDLGDDVRLIIVLRDPAERAYSAWKMWNSFVGNPRKGSKADSRTFVEAMTHELCCANEEANRPYNYVEKGRYAEQIRRYLASFSRDRILVMDYAEMSRHLHAFLGKICEFLEISGFDRAESDALKGQRYWEGPKKAVAPDEQEMIERLRAYYAPYNIQLQELLNYEFKW